MKHGLLIITLLFSVSAFSQIEKLNLGLNVIPLALNQTVDISTEYRIDSTKSFVLNLGGTFNNKQDYALCFQCAERPRIQSLNAYSIKLNFRKYYKKKRKSEHFFALGAVIGYYNKNYNGGLIDIRTDTTSQKNYSQKKYIFSPNLQLGRTVHLNKHLSFDFGTQFNLPINYKGVSEPPHYTPTRGMGVLNFFFIFKFKLD